MVEGIRKCIIELKNLEQGIEYAVAEINKGNADLVDQEKNVVQLTYELETLRKENESLKKENEELKNKIKELEKDESGNQPS